MYGGFFDHVRTHGNEIGDNDSSNYSIVILNHASASGVAQLAGALFHHIQKQPKVEQHTALLRKHTWPKDEK
jgi:hypothetical protein